METTKKLFALLCLFVTMNQAISVSDPDHMETFCMKSSRNTKSNTTYNKNLKTLLSTLSNQSSFANYYNLTTGLASETVHGMFLCTGDVNRTTCNACVKDATIEIAKNCTNHREAIIYNVDCIVRYSDKFFLTTLETNPSYWWSSHDLIPKSFGKFGQRLSDKMGEVIVRSSLFDNLYDLESIVQCTPDLDPRNCTTCLKLALQELTECCGNQVWAFIYTPNCMVSFDTYNSSLPPLPPPSRSGSFSHRGTTNYLGEWFLLWPFRCFHF
ncbi:Cysteine-rich repeat secretory protein 58 [Arabidopsis thaliana]